MVEEQACSPAPKVDSSELQLEVISDFGRFLSIGPEWDRLVDVADVDRMFLSHTWFRTWWESFGEGRQLHVITARCSGELVAAIPMMQTGASIYGFGVKSIESIYNPHTPRCDFIIAKDQGGNVYREVWKHLSQTSECDLVVLKQIPRNSPTLSAMDSLGRADGWHSGQWSGRPSPYVSLGCGYEEFIHRVKGGHRYNLRKRYERLNRLGSIDVEVITKRAAVRDAMQDGMRIEAAAWKGGQGTAISSDAVVAEFYTRLAEREAELEQLRLSFLCVGGKRISFNYILRSQSKLYGMKIGYDPQYHIYSPGNTLLNLILQRACAEGIAEYDFLGIDDDWKFDWTKEARPHRWLFLFRDHLRPKLLHYLKFNVVPKMKRVRSRGLHRLRGY